MCKVASNCRIFAATQQQIHSFWKGGWRQGYPEDAESVNANRPYNADGCLPWPSIDASGGSPKPRNLVGSPLTRARRFLSFRSTPHEGCTMTCASKSAAY